MRIRKSWYVPPTQRGAMSEYGRRVAWVKQKLNASEPITGDLNEFALELVPDPGPTPSKSEEVWVSIANKMKAGERLGDYEHHMMVDMILLHVRLGAATQEREGGCGPSLV